MSSTEFTLDGEHETRNGWLYTFTLNLGAEISHYELTLSWVDHEHLVGGSVAPELVAKASFALAIESLGDRLPGRIDVSSLRRRIDGFDANMRSRINAPL